MPSKYASHIAARFCKELLAIGHGSIGAPLKMACGVIGSVKTAKNCTRLRGSQSGPRLRHSPSTCATISRKLNRPPTANTLLHSGKDTCS